MSFNDWADQFSGPPNQASSQYPPGQVYPTNYPPPQPYQPQIRTNRFTVNGLNNALNMPAPLNSEMIYFEQDASKQIIYIIRTDLYGAKTYQVLKYAADQPIANGMVTREEFDNFAKKITTILNQEVPNAAGKFTGNASANDENGI